MKKAFNFKLWAIGALLMLGNAVAFGTARPAGDAGPADGTAVGATVKIGDVMGLVTYRVTGWDATNNFYTVSITGFDADGLDALAAARAAGTKVTLRIPVSFNEKFGEVKYNYAVTKIEDGLNDDGVTKQSFYGLTEVDTLIFVDGPVPATQFAYTVGTPGLHNGKSFYGCSNMKKLQFTSNCSYIGQYSFQNTAIREFVIPKACAEIRECAFYNCKFLKTVTVEAGNNALHELGDYVFGNSALTTLDLTNASQLWTITGQPFMYNLSVINDVLTTVKLPSNVKDIDFAFVDCTALTNIYGFENTKLGEAAGTPTGSPAGTHIKDGAFKGCKSLTRLDIPSCDVIGSPFVGCAALDTLTFKALYNKVIGKTLALNKNLYGTFDKTLPAYSEKDQSALKVIEFNGNLNGTIEDNAFVGTLALAKVDFKGKLQSNTHIKGAFMGVTSLAEVVFNGINSDGVANVTIENNAFRNTGITALDFMGINLQSGSNMNFEIWPDAFADCANLTDIKTGDITVKNAGTIDIQNGAFVRNPLLAKVTFGTTTFTGAGTVQIANNAFAIGNSALKDVEFGAINSTVSGTGYNGTFTIGTGSRVFGDGLNLETVKFGDINASNFSIANGAFGWTETVGTLYPLKQVDFGNISSAKGINSNFYIGQKAFYGGHIDDKVVTFGNFSENPNATNTAGSLTAWIDQDAFGAPKLKEVTFGNITAIDFDIDLRAFQSVNLQKVKIGNIAKSSIGVSDFDIANFAFQGGEVAAKAVEIGNIGDLTGAKIGWDAFAADSLQSVKIGNMTPTSLLIDMRAFAGLALTSVDLGNVGAGVTTGGQSFANLNMTDALTETIKIGNLNAAVFSPGDFRGPQGEGSAMNVTIKAFAAAVNLPAGTFEAPGFITAKDGSASFTIEDNVVAGAFANVAAGAFEGAQKYELGAAVDNATNVWFQGNYVAEFPLRPAFTHVKDLKVAVGADGSAKTYGVAGHLTSFAGAQTVTIGNMPTGASIDADGTTETCGGTTDIVEITFLKNVADAGAIGIFDSPVLRKIEFKTVDQADVKVAAAAAVAAAFQAAGTAAATAKEKVSVIYRENQTREAEIIFNQTAFAAAAGSEIATLYTSSWVKANVYEAEDAALGTQCVFRMAYSESDVAPGEPIMATTSKKDGQVYAYAKLYIPKGTNMKYKVPAQYVASADKNAVQLYFGRIDNSNNKIYMYNMPVIDDYYWIDATDVDQQFVLRVNTDIVTLNEEVSQDANGNYVVTAQNPTEEDLATFAAGDPADYYFFDAALAVQNQLRYNPAEIANQELKNNAEFAGRDIYVMANPKTQGFAFAKFDKNGTYTKDTGDHLAGDLRCLSAKSLYIVGKVNDASKLTVVFEGDEDFDANETTGIKDVKSIDANDGVIYNLQGVRVNNATKGIFIQNGKKYVIK